MNRIVLVAITATLSLKMASSQADDRPNVLICISDDVSYPHASAYGSKMVRTPAFDRVAKDGVLFHNAFCPAPGCSPSRASLLTGRHIWMIEEAGTHASYFQAKYTTFPEQLQNAGYCCGSVGKGWAPGDFKKHGREQNPAGKVFAGKDGYVAGFQRFLDQKPDNQPFCFWFGSSDAHRSFQKGAGLKKGMSLEQAEVPGFLPDTPEIRSDLLDYAFEVERFDDDCDQILHVLETSGLLDNTLIIITSDNGMAFPRAKANCYEYGIHMPLALCWKKQIPKARQWSDLVGFADLTATIYEATGVASPEEFPVVGRSLLSDLRSDKTGVADASRDAVLSGRERHSSSRFNSLGYPQRAIRTPDYLYIHNFRPERWPAGPGQRFDDVMYSEGNDIVSAKLSHPHAGYHDIDACPSLSFLVNHRDEADIAKYLELAVGKRPAEELFDIHKDPDCLTNLANDSEYEAVRDQLKNRLFQELRATNDARVIDGGEIWESYPRTSDLRWFPTPDWAIVDPAKIPQQLWIERSRPRK